MPKKYLPDVYGDAARADLTGYYDAWAGSYDSELAENEYEMPKRLAAALADVDTPHDSRILDYGCGTGLGGEAFVAHGFTLIDGTDVSANMLAAAEAKQIYGRLWLTDPDAPVTIAPGEYAVIAAVGVVSPGAAPAQLLGTLADALEPGGRLAFSFNDHALSDPSYIEALRDLPNRSMTVLHESYGEHLVAMGMKSTVYVFEKA
ncbi:MAG: methyltransferase domain-containing protein [Pseudomonadota bacterium]